VRVGRKERWFEVAARHCSSRFSTFFQLKIAPAELCANVRFML
jgi:hypothetical protein